MANNGPKDLMEVRVMRKYVGKYLLLYLALLAISSLLFFGCRFSSSTFFTPELSPSTPSTLTLKKNILTLSDPNGNKGIVIEGVSYDSTRKALFLAGSYGVEENALFVRLNISDSGDLNKVWSVTGSIGVYANDAYAAPDGYYATGYGLSSEFFLSKLNPDDGSTIWVKKIANTAEGITILPMSDDSLVVGGRAFDPSDPSSSDAVIARVRSDGTPLWARFYFSEATLAASGLDYISSRNMIVSASNEALMFLNAYDGNLIKAIYYGEVEIRKVFYVGDGVIFLGVRDFAPSDNFIIAKVDLDGNVVWAKSMDRRVYIDGAEVKDGKLYVHTILGSSPRANSRQLKYEALESSILVFDTSNGSPVALKKLPFSSNVTLTHIGEGLSIAGDYLLLGYGTNISLYKGLLVVYPLSLDDSGLCATMIDYPTSPSPVKDFSFDTIMDITGSIITPSISIADQTISTDSVEVSLDDWCSIGD